VKLRTFLQQYGDVAPEKAKELFKEVNQVERKKFTEKFEAEFKKFAPAMQSDFKPETLTTEQLDEFSASAKNVYFMISKRREWTKHVCSDEQLQVFKKAAVTIQTTRSEKLQKNSKLRETMQDDFTQLCNDIASITQDEAKSRIDGINKKYGTCMTTDEKKNLQQLEAISAQVSIPLWKIIYDNRTVLKGVELFPKSLPGYHFHKTTEDYLYCTGTDPAGKSVRMKFAWNELDQHKTELLDDIIMRLGCIDKLDRKE